MSDFSISDIYDAAMARMREQRSQAGQASKAAYDKLAVDTQAAYEALDREAAVNKALSERAYGMAGDRIATLAQRRETNYQNTLGENARARERSLDTVELEGGNAEVRQAADETASSATLAALQNEALVSQSRFDKQLGLRQRELDLKKQSNQFSQAYQMLAGGMMDEKGFEGVTGIKVRKPPQIRPANIESASAIVQDATAAASQTQVVAFKENRMEYTDGGENSEVTGMTTSEYLAAHEDEYVEKYGRNSYNLAVAYVNLKAGFEPFKGTWYYNNMSILDDLFRNSEAYIEQYGEEKYYGRLYLALEAAGGLYNELVPIVISYVANNGGEEAVSYSSLKETFPQYLGEYDYSSADINDILNEYYDLPPESIDMDAIAAQLNLPDWYEKPEEWNWDSLIEAMCLSEYMNWCEENGIDPQSVSMSDLPDNEYVQFGASIYSGEDPDLIARRAHSSQVAYQMYIEHPDIYGGVVDDYLEAAGVSDYSKLDADQQFELAQKILKQAYDSGGYTEEMQQYAAAKGQDITLEAAENMGYTLFQLDLNKGTITEADNQGEAFVAENSLVTIDGDNGQVVIFNEYAENNPEEFEDYINPLTGGHVPVRGTWDARTGLINEDGYGTYYNNSLPADMLNDIISMQMYLACTGQEVQEDQLEVLRLNGLEEIADFILSKKEGDYYELTENVRNQLMQEIMSGVIKADQWQEKLSTSGVTDQQVRANADFEQVVANPPRVSATWNPYFTPSIDAIYTTVQYGYKLNQAYNNHLHLIEQLDLALANGDLSQEQYDALVTPEQEFLKDPANMMGIFDFLSEDMYETFTYLYVKAKETGDDSAFREYFNIFKEELTNAQWQTYYGTMDGLVDKKGPWGEMLSGVAAVGGKLASPTAYVETLWDGIAGQEVDTSSPSQLMARSGTAFSALTASTTESGFGKWAIQTTIDLAASAPAFAINPVAGAAYMGLQAAGQDVAIENMNGATIGEALAHSTVMGGITFFSSLVMLKGFKGIMAGTRIPATLGQRILTYGLNAIEAFGLGGVTGTVGTLIGNVADLMMKGDRSNYAQRVNEYMNRKEDPMTEDEARTAAAVDLFLKEPIEAGLKTGAIAAVMSIPGTAGAIRSAETLGGRAAVADEQGAFRTLRALEEAPGGVKSNLSQGMSLLEQINARLGRESGMANREAFSTDAANRALMDYLSGKGSAKAAAEAFSKVANEAIASGKLTAAEVSALEGYVGTAQMYIDVLGLLGDNGVVSGAGNAVESYKAAKAANWKKPDGSTWWPDDEGFADTPDETTLQPGTKIDRYGKTSGVYASPEGTPYEQRSLAPGSENSPYNIYEVVRPFDVKAGTVAPWFDQPGGGTQYKLPMSIQELIDLGYIKLIIRQS